MTSITEDRNNDGKEESGENNVQDDSAAFQHSVTVPEIHLVGLGNSDDDDFRPLLTAFNMTGRPRSDLVKVRETGRLQIFAVPNKRPVLVRSLRDGRLRMWIVDGDELAGEQ